ncbi:MAG: PEP-CTERM sorting domain-containing protein [Alphaproteobacteria bacterium]
MRWLSLVVLATAALFYTTAAQADVSWNLIVTDTARVPGSGGLYRPSLLPAVGAILTVSDAVFQSGELFFSFFVNDRDTWKITIDGTTDFSLETKLFFTNPELPLDPAVPHPSLLNGNIDVMISPTGELDGAININTTMINLNLGFANNIMRDSFLASDGPFICGDFSQCTIEGHWELTSALPVPEPSTASVLLAAIAVFGLRRWHRPLAR